jgi:YHS domain-containing protein
MPIVGAGVLFLSVCAQAAAAQTAKPSPPSGQQHQHEPPPKPAAVQPVDHSQMDHGAMPGAREGSGTAWLPDASPMYALHRQRGQWQFMAHGNGFLQYLDDGSDRGSDQVGSINWVMGMAERNLGSGRLALRGMFSLEPFTIGGCGYPDLLATGELCDGEPIHDRQHQHDLFMEIAAMYDAPLAGSLRWQVYGGPAGEPALGPVAYPHRISAMPNLLAPIGHHWLDATHITFGVVTAGVYGSHWKAEASVFNGREPDEERTGFDLAPLDSVSGRVWYLPTSNLALQVSGGRLNEAEPGDDGEPRVDVTRLTASATYHRLRDQNGIWASTIAWGRNVESGQATNALLFETTLTLQDRDSWFGRFEIAGKTAHDLDVPVDHHEEEEQVFAVSKLQAGYTRYFDAWQDLKPGIGVTASLAFVPRALEPFYGDRVSPGVGIYLTVRPAAMRMAMTHAGAAPSAHAHPVPPPAAQTPLPAAPVTARPPADPHAAHATPPPAATTAPGAKPAAKPVDPHATHAAPPPARSKATAKPAAGHAGHTATPSKPSAKPAPTPAPPASASKFADDPKKLVCSPAIDSNNAPTTTYKGKAYYFCSAAERLRFIKNPETYLKAAGRK